MDRVAVADLKPDPENRRTHTARNLEMVTASLRDVGAARSIVIDENDLVLAGNGVVQAAADAGITKVQVVEVDGSTLVAVRRRGLSADQKRALAIYDNRTAELAEWNVAQLEADQAAGLTLEPWFTEDEFGDMTTVAAHRRGREGLTDPDAVPDLRPTAIQPGDLFALGTHRLLCGDASAPDLVARLMDGQAADLVFTSPPYWQQRDYGQAIADWDALMRGVFGTLPAHASTQVLVNLGLIYRDGDCVPYWDGWIAEMAAAGWRRFGWYVWDQGFGLPGDWNGRLAPSHEWIFHFNKIAVKPVKWVDKQPTSIHLGHGRGLRRKDGTVAAKSNIETSLQPTKIPDSILRITRHMARGMEKAHPAVFPVELPRFLMRCWPGLTYEPFAGSGSAFIAAEAEGVRCVGVELEPRYCQLIVDRWEAFTGAKAAKVGEVAA